MRWPPPANAKDQRPAERVRCIASLDGPPSPAGGAGSLIAIGQAVHLHGLLVWDRGV